MDEVITPDLASLVCEQVRNFVVCEGQALKPSMAHGPTVVQTRDITFSPLSRDEKDYSDPEKRSQATEETVAADLAKLQHAYDRRHLFVIGKEQMKIRVGTRLWRKVLLNMFLWMRENTRTKIANLKVPIDKIVEVGFVKEV
jgi:KUP system potassium uptake protein